MVVAEPVPTLHSGDRPWAVKSLSIGSVSAYLLLWYYLIFITMNFIASRAESSEQQVKIVKVSS